LTNSVICADVFEHDAVICYWLHYIIPIRCLLYLYTNI